MTELIVVGPVLFLDHWSSDGRRVLDLSVGQLPLPLMAPVAFDETGVVIGHIGVGVVGTVEEVRFILATHGPTVWARARVLNDELADRFTTSDTGRLPCGVDLTGGAWTFDESERGTLAGARLAGLTVYLGEESPAFDDAHLAATYSGLVVGDVPAVAP